MRRLSVFLFFFFFNDTATTEIYTLSLHDALPISVWSNSPCFAVRTRTGVQSPRSRSSDTTLNPLDRKSTRLNSSHSQISYAVFCLKKKKKTMSRVIYISHEKKIPSTTCLECGSDH